jgi:hypothetical protein
MLRKLRDLHAWTVETCDDRVVGRVDDFLVDDEHWVVRYLVVGTGQAFPERHMLVSTLGIEGIDWDGMRIVTELTRGQVRTSGMPMGLSGLDSSRRLDLRPRSTKGPASLRSVRGIRGCRVHSLTGPIGRIDDVFAEDEHWKIPYLEITSSHSAEGAMLIPPQWIRSMDWAAGVVSVEAANYKTVNNPMSPSWRHGASIFEAR